MPGELTSLLLKVGQRLENRWDDVRRAVKGELGWLDPVTIMPYRGYGDAARLRLSGRVLESGAKLQPQPGDDAWRTLVRMLHRFESDEVPGARVRARFDGREQEVVADREGYIDVAFDGLQLDSDPVGDARWRDVELELLEPLRAGQTTPPRVVAKALTPPRAAAFGVVSDIDDTIIKTGATDLIANWRTLLLKDAEDRTPFPGVAAFYRALERGTGDAARNPIFYVSSSPWNLYDLLERFMQVHGIPVGPMALRDLGFDGGKLRLKGGHDEHKIKAIERLFAFYPQMRFILIGDSGQHDAEIYAEITHRHPTRVLAVYIRDVSTDARDAEAQHLLDEVRKAGAQAQFGPDLVLAARNAAAHGWIAAGAVADVEREVAATPSA